MLNFCTLFDSSYLSRGIAMYESLEEHCKKFHLYIFAFDDRSHKILQTLKLKNATIVSLSEFEEETLLALKPTRSKGEYCWTCTPSTILYVLENYAVDNCTYLDADLLFYSDPKVLIEEMGNNSSLIISHRYTTKYDQSLISGTYCVQFMTFMKTMEGLKILKWWRDACNEWCYARVEDGKFGDQKYLDSWKAQFKGVHELQHLGGGVAPWNVQQYELFEKNNKLYGQEKKSGNEFELVFYHFHGLKFLQNDQVDLCDYELSESVKDFLYKPYLQKLKKITDYLIKFDSSLNPNGMYIPDNAWKNFSKNMKRKIKGNYNIFNNAKLIH